jgi:CDP-diacylglycerol--serine O-phosphatidyltransferase
MAAQLPPKGIYILPNLFTTAALFAGFFAIVAGIDGHFVKAAIAVVVAGLLDGLDGRIARMTHTQSEFGVQYDSLADLISFGLAPALLLYLWALPVLKPLGPFWEKVCWLAAFVYAACAALRLARFNTQAGVADKRFFQGLASPAAAGLVVSLIWVTDDYGLGGARVVFPVMALSIAAALLMVSRVRYVSFKTWPMREPVPFVRILALVMIFVLLALETPTVLSALALSYVLSGPVMTLAGRRRRLSHRFRRRKDRGEAEAQEHD